MLSLRMVNGQSLGRRGVGVVSTSRGVPHRGRRNGCGKRLSRPVPKKYTMMGHRSVWGRDHCAVWIIHLASVEGAKEEAREELYSLAGLVLTSLERFASLHEGSGASECRKSFAFQAF